MKINELISELQHFLGFFNRTTVILRHSTSFLSFAFLFMKKKVKAIDLVFFAKQSLD